MILTILAWLVIILILFNIISTPGLLGQDKGKYTYSSYIMSLISAVIVLPLAFRVLGII